MKRYPSDFVNSDIIDSASRFGWSYATDFSSNLKKDPFDHTEYQFRQYKDAFCRETNDGTRIEAYLFEGDSEGFIGLAHGFFDKEELGAEYPPPRSRAA